VTSCALVFKIVGFPVFITFKLHLLKKRVDDSVVYNLLSNKLCQRRVAVWNIRNVLHSVVALCFAVSILFTVFSHKFYNSHQYWRKGKLVPFNPIHFEWRYAVINNNVGINWKWVVHLKTPSFYPPVRIL
jgi:hypothetical protein